MHVMDGILPHPKIGRTEPGVAEANGKLLTASGVRADGAHVGCPSD